MKQLKCTTLDDDNYFSWKPQLGTLFWAYKLLDFVEGKVTIIRGSTTKQQDQLILIWIFAWISSSILPQVASLTTSTEVWDAFQQLFASDSETRILHMRFQLQSICKNNLMMIEYLRKMSIAKESSVAADDKFATPAHLDSVQRSQRQLPTLHYLHYN